MSDQLDREVAETQDGGVTVTSTAAELCTAAVSALPRSHGALGRYVLLHVVGRGGMGVVWEAFDTVLDRRIALKLLVPRMEASERVVVEARALARVQHPNVVTVHDAGVYDADGFELAYVAMELVTGRNLKGWLAEQPRAPAEVLAMFVLAGRGLEAAHAAGVIHRDFKPSNVLMSDDGRVRVSDFGLAVVGTPELGAVATAASATTRSSTPLAGTPRYMSPEQLEGVNADAASDQFAFCVSLYEAIYGEHPFDAPADASFEELRTRMSRLPKPPVRSRLGARLSPILQRGLAVDPAQRWSSMRELLAALEAARGMPGKRWLVAGAIAIAVAAVALVGWREATSPERACRSAAGAMETTWNPRTRDALAAEFAKAGAMGSEAWKLVAPALDAWAARWRSVRIEQCEADRNGTRPTPALTARRECLDRGLGELRGLVDAFGKPDETVVKYATRAAHALRPPESCLSAMTPVAELAAPPRDPAAVSQTRARIDRAASLRLVGKLHPAVEEAKAAAEEAKRIGWAPLTTDAQLELGRALVDTNQAAAATDAIYLALWSAEAVRDDMARVQAAIGLSVVSIAASEYNHAARWIRTARAIAAHLPADTALDIRLRYHEMRVAAWKNDFKQCVQLGEENLRIAETAKIDSADVNTTMISLARCYSSLEQGDKAVAYLERVLPLTKKLNGYYDQQTASTLTELGVQARRAGDPDKALRYYREALAVREHLAGPEDPDCAAVHNNVANVYRDLGRYDEARASLKRALDIFQKAYGPSSPAVAAAISGMGRIAMAEGKPAAAEPLFRQAVAIMRKKREPGHPDLLGDVALLAESLLAMHEPEALDLFEEVLAGTEKDGDATNGDKAYARFWAARARLELGIRREGAIELAEMSCKALDQKDWKSDYTACRAWLAAHGTK